MIHTFTNIHSLNLFGIGFNHLYSTNSTTRFYLDSIYNCSIISNKFSCFVLFRHYYRKQAVFKQVYTTVAAEDLNQGPQSVLLSIYPHDKFRKYMTMII